MTKPLRLVTEPTGETKPWVDPRRAMITAWGRWIEKRGDKLYPSDWGPMMNILFRRFEIPDEKTGELMVCYPEETEWEEKLEGWFTNSDFARTCNYSFVGFLSKNVYPTIRPKSKQQAVTGRLPKCDNRLADGSICGGDHHGFNCPKIKPASEEVRAQAIADLKALTSGMVVKVGKDGGKDYTCEKCGGVHSPLFICGGEQ